MNKELEQLLDIARKAARAGTEAIKDIYVHYLSNGDIGIKDKGKDDPVTSADMAANRVIINTITKYLPEHVILTEEDPGTWDVTGSEWAWMIDPLDGTRDFIKANDEFVTMVGLTHLGQPVVGVVIEPATGLEIYACKGLGAYRENTFQGIAGERLKFPDKVDSNNLRIAISRSHRDSKTDNLIRLLNIKKEIPSGSVGRKVAMVISGRADMYVHPARGTKLWDTCACDIIASEAGGVLLSGTGEKINYARTSGDVENPYGLLVCAAHISDRVIWASREVWGLNNH